VTVISVITVDAVEHLCW